MLNLGKLGETGTISPQETIDISFKLNMMVKQWMGTKDFAPGLKMWTRQRGDLFLGLTQNTYNLGPSGDHWTASYSQKTLTVAAASSATVLTVGVGNTSVYTVNDYIGVLMSTGDLFWSTVASINAGLGTVTMNAGLTSGATIGTYVFNYTTKQQRPLELVTCLLRDINNSDTPINFMTVQDYEFLPSKTMTTFQSDPTAVYYEQQLTNGVLRIDCGGAQDVTKHLHVVFVRPIQDFNNPLDNPEYSQEWFLPLSWGLSKLIAPMFNAVWTKEMEDNYSESLAIARRTNPETTTLYFQSSQ